MRTAAALLAMIAIPAFAEIRVPSPAELQADAESICREVRADCAVYRKAATLLHTIETTSIAPSAEFAIEPSEPRTLKMLAYICRTRTLARNRVDGVAATDCIVDEIQRAKWHRDRVKLSISGRLPPLPTRSTARFIVERDENDRQRYGFETVNSCWTYGGHSYVDPCLKLRRWGLLLWDIEHGHRKLDTIPDLGIDLRIFGAPKFHPRTANVGTCIYETRKEPLRWVDALAVFECMEAAARKASRYYREHPDG